MQGPSKPEIAFLVRVLIKIYIYVTLNRSEFMDSGGLFDKVTG